MFNDNFSWQNKRDNGKKQSDARLKRRSREPSSNSDGFIWPSSYEDGGFPDTPTAVVEESNVSETIVPPAEPIATGRGIYDLIEESIETTKPDNKGFEFKSEVKNSSFAYGDSRDYSYGSNVESFITLSQIPFPNCCGIAILKSISMSSELTQKDFNLFIDNIKKDLELNDKYGKIMIYTTTQERCHNYFNKYPDIIHIDSMVNPRTGRNLVGFEINLTVQKKENPAMAGMSFFDAAVSTPW